MVKTLRSIEAVLLRAEKALLVAMLVFMVTLAFAQVVLRSAFSFGLLWADTLLRHLVLWVGFFGAAVAAGENKQFAMDAAHRLFSDRAKAAVAALTHLSAMMVSGFLARASWTFFLDERRAGATLFSAGAVHLPPWIF